MPSKPSESLMPERKSIFGSLRKLGRKNDNPSQISNAPARSQSRSTESRTPSNNLLGPAELSASSDCMGRKSPSPLTNPSPATRRPDRPGMNAFTVPSNEPPPAYTGPGLAGSTADTPAASRATGGEDPYSFLSTFDTTLLIDDSGSMAGRSWREVSQALSTIAPIVTKHDKDGIDVYFLNHKSKDAGSASGGIAPGGYRGIRRSETVTEIFQRVQPSGGTPTGISVHHILKPYLKKCEIDLTAGKEVKPLNLIVLTDGVPSDDVESIIISAAKKLDRIDAPPHQVGVQFFQVGNEPGAREALEELDDELCNMVQGGIRDIVDTVTWTGGVSSSQSGVGLTADGILKALLGAVVKRLDRRPASGDIRRPRRN